MLSNLPWFRNLFTRYPTPTDVFTLLQRDADIARNIRVTFVLIAIGSVIAFYFVALYQQSDIINLMNQNIDTTDIQLQQQIFLLGELLNPVRLAFVLQYPTMYWFFGYSNKYTGRILGTILAVESPTPQRLVRALALLESGITVLPTTVPPTLLQAVIDQVFPRNTYQSSLQIPPAPLVTAAPTTWENVQSIVGQAWPIVSTMLFLI